MLWKGAVATGAHTKPAGQSAWTGGAETAHARTCVDHVGLGRPASRTGLQLPWDAVDPGALMTTPATPARHALVSSTGVQAPGVRVEDAHEVVAAHVTEVAKNVSTGAEHWMPVGKSHEHPHVVAATFSPAPPSRTWPPKLAPHGGGAASPT